MAKRSSINSFFGGVSNSPRERTRTGFVSAKGFDIYTDPNRLIPLRRFVDDDNVFATNITRFLRAKDLTSTALYGLGRVAGSEKIKLYKRTGDNVWAEEQGAESVAGIGVNVMIEYKNALYGGSGNNIWRYNNLDQVVETYTEAWQTLTSPLTCQPILHPTSDVLYFGYENKLASLDNTTFNATALVTIPDDYTIKDITPFGEFVAIACEPDNVSNPSYVYLWSQNTDGEFAAIYDIGVGKIGWLVELEGRLFVAKYSSTAREPKITIADISSGELGIVKEIIDTDRQASLFLIRPLSKYKENNVLYFGANFGGYDSVWSFGRKSQEFPFVLAEGFQIAGVEGATNEFVNHIYNDNSNWFGSYGSADSSVVRMDITGNTYDTNIYTSQINPSMDFRDLSSEKAIRGVGVRTTLMTAGQSVEVEYSVDGGAFQTGFTHSSGVVTEATIQVPYFREIQFKVKSVGGAEIVEPYYDYELVNSLL